PRMQIAIYSKGYRMWPTRCFRVQAMSTTPLEVPLSSCLGTLVKWVPPSREIRQLWESGCLIRPSLRILSRVRLRQVHRQAQDQSFVRLLNALRNGKDQPRDI
ncbi:hypothetical protein BGZ90_005599, partial [Linnemannia elongata]